MSTSAGTQSVFPATARPPNSGAFRAQVTPSVVAAASLGRGWVLGFSFDPVEFGQDVGGTLDDPAQRVVVRREDEVLAFAEAHPGSTISRIGITSQVTRVVSSR